MVSGRRSAAVLQSCLGFKVQGLGFTASERQRKIAKGPRRQARVSGTTNAPTLASNLYGYA